MSDTDLIIVCAAFGSALSGVLLFLLRKKFFTCVRPHKEQAPQRHAAFSLGGNLVRDVDTPIEDTYNVTKSVLGHGSSARVVVGEHKVTKRKYAIKIVELTRKEVAWRYEREKNFLRDIDHTNVVRLYEVYREPTALCFVMELCTGGHLGQVLRASRNGRLKENVAREYIQQLTRAIVHCHHHGICHRDVKLQNVLLESKNKDAQIKLLDFGNGARYRGHLPMRKIVGTTYTAAPEVFKECYDERCDVWSLGVVTFILLSGQRPFEKKPLTADEEARLPPAVVQEGGSVVASILLGNYDFNHEVWDDISSEAINFIQYCLVLDYTKRNTAAEMLEHPWLTYSDHEFPTVTANGLSRISRSSASTLQRTLQRDHTASSQFAGFRNASMLAVAFNIPTDKIQKLRALFQEMDQDGSGSIDRDEFYTAVQSVNPDMSKESVYEIFDRMDQDWNRCISFIEFLAAMVDPEDIDMQDMNQAFQLLDIDNKGYITRDDLLAILSTGNAEDLEISQRQPPPLPASPHGPAGVLVKSLSTKLLGTNSGGFSSPSRAMTEGTLGPRSGVNSAVGSGIGSSSPSESALVSGNAGVTGPTNVLGTSSSNGGSSRGGSMRDSRKSSAEEKERAKLVSAKLKMAAKSAVRRKKLQERIQDIVDKADVNKDGVISYTEFLFAMAEGAVGSKHSNGISSLDSLQHAPSVVHNSPIKSPRRGSRILAPLSYVGHSSSGVPSPAAVTPSAASAGAGAGIGVGKGANGNNEEGTGALFNFRSALAPLIVGTPHDNSQQQVQQQQQQQQQQLQQHQGEHAKSAGTPVATAGPVVTMTPTGSSSKQPVPLFRQGRRQTDGSKSIQEFAQVEGSSNRSLSRRASEPMAVVVTSGCNPRSPTAPGGEDSADANMHNHHSNSGSDGNSSSISVNMTGAGSGAGMVGVQRGRGTGDMSLDPVPEVGNKWFGCFGVSVTKTTLSNKKTNGPNKSSNKYSGKVAVAGPAETGTVQLFQDPSRDQQPSQEDLLYEECSSDVDDSSKIPTFFQQNPGGQEASTMDRFRSFRNKSVSFRSTGSTRAAGAGAGATNATPRSHRGSDPGSISDAMLTTRSKSSIVEGILGVFSSTVGGGSSNRSSGRAAGGSSSARVGIADIGRNNEGIDLESGNAALVSIGARGSTSFGSGDDLPHGSGGATSTTAAATTAAVAGAAGGSVGITAAGSSSSDGLHSARIYLDEVSRHLEKGYALEDDMRMNDDDQGLLSVAPYTHSAASTGPGGDDDRTISSCPINEEEEEADAASDVRSFDDASVTGLQQHNLDSPTDLHSPHSYNIPETNSNRSSINAADSDPGSGRRGIANTGVGISGNQDDSGGERNQRQHRTGGAGHVDLASGARGRSGATNGAVDIGADAGSYLDNDDDSLSFHEYMNTEVFTLTGAGGYN